MTANSTAMPIAVSRTDDTRSMRRTALSRANWISARGSSSNTMKSMIVGSASGTLVQRSENFRNDPILRREREDQRAEIRERQAAQPADDRGRERR